jgi:hypothetical protein
MLFTSEDMFIFLIISLFVVSIKTDVKVKSLCDDTWIASADRLPNNTYRVYRDDYYWTLVGLPDRVAKVEGPFKIPYKYMAPLNKTSKIMTVGSGVLSGNTWKFDGRKYWQWRPDGSLLIGGLGGVEWDQMPPFGLSCVMNDGDLDKKGSTRMIGLKALNAYYWRTDTSVFTPVGDIQKGYLGGQFGEKFPADATACMTSASSDTNTPYFVYIFKMKEYCYRPIKGEDGCKE